MKYNGYKLIYFDFGKCIFLPKFSGFVMIGPNVRYKMHVKYKRLLEYLHNIYKTKD